MATRTRRKRATAAQLRALKKARAAKRRIHAGRVRAGKKAARTRKRRGNPRKAVKRRRRRRRNPGLMPHSPNQPKRRKKNVARRKRKTVRRRRRRVTSRRRRRNVGIGFRPQKILKSFQQGVMDAAGVVGGKAATRIVANFLPLPKDGMILNFAVQGLSAIIVGMVAQQVFGGNTARMMIAGGFAAPVESLMSGLPFIGPMLGDDQLLYGDYLMGQVDLPMGEYPEIGEYVEEAPMGQVDLPLGEYVEY